MNDLLTDLGGALLLRARNAIAIELGAAPRSEQDHPQLEALGATFVTLMMNDELRGCIGSLEAWRVLDIDVRANARAAAFNDPRFAPLAPAEFAVTRIEVSLLGAAVPLVCVDEADALCQLRPGIDGVILECRSHRSTFLPQVWEILPEPKAFLTHLKQKAGLPAGFWAEDVSLRRYEVQKWKEPTTT